MKAGNGAQAPDILHVVDFGKIAAEDDQRLSDYFVTTPSFDELFAQRKYVAIGRKGAGKTALYQGLEDAADSTTFVRGLQFSDYPWRLHDHALNQNASTHERFVNSWRFLALVELAKLVLTDQSSLKPEVQQSVREFLMANWGELQFSHKNFYRPTEFVVTSTEIKPQALGIQAAGLRKERIARERIGESLGETLDWLEQALAAMVNPANKYFVLFDELDTNFATDDPGYQARLTGLLLAAKKVAAWADASALQARAVVFLRSDIFDWLQFADKNKIRDDASIQVRWTDDETGPQSLRALMNERIRLAMNLGRTEPDPWSVAFDTTERMPGTQQKYKHMTARTYLRPRDMIKFANLALAKAQERLRSRDGVHKIVNEDIQKARPAYSEYLKDELDDEFGGHRPAWQDLLELLRRMGTEVFSRSQFDAEFKSLSGYTSGAEVLELLFGFSIIGFLKRGGSGGGSEFVFRYEQPGVRLDPSAAQFRAHPGLKEYLALVQER